MEKKQTLLLTVIAVATLLVAVVGATFAYFTAQGNTGASSQINVLTSTTASSNFTVDSTLKIDVNQDNFSADDGHVSNSVNGRASFTSSSAAAGDALNYCYTVTLNITTNTFAYQEGQTTPNLLLKITKDGTEIISGVGNLQYKTVAAELTRPKAEVAGFDITTATGSYLVGSQHKIETGAPNTEGHNAWVTTVTVVNLDLDQQFIANKQFAATFVFDQAVCA